MKKTTMQLNNVTKDVLSAMGSKNESYDDILQRLLINNLCDDEELEKFLTGIDHDKKACFYLGVLEVKTYENAADKKIWGEITKLNSDNFKKVFADFGKANASENGMSNESILEKISVEILACENDFSGLTSDEMRYYYTLGKTLAHKF